MFRFLISIAYALQMEDASLEDILDCWWGGGSVRV